jgi:hypothetical protein
MGPSSIQSGAAKVGGPWSVVLNYWLRIAHVLAGGMVLPSIQKRRGQGGGVPWSVRRPMCEIRGSGDGRSKGPQ